MFPDPNDFDENDPAIMLAMIACFLGIIVGLITGYLLFQGYFSMMCSA